MTISVIGSGRWGTFIAWYLNEIGQNVLLNGLADSLDFQHLAQTRKNDYLTLPMSVSLSSDAAIAFENSTIFIVIAAQNLRSFCRLNAHRVKQHHRIVLCMKGLEKGTGKRLTQVIAEEWGENIPVAILVGPGHVQSLIQKIPTCLLIDSENEIFKLNMQDLLSSDFVRIYAGTDLIGSEIGAATKNIMGIAAGLLDGLGMEALKGALMARGVYEVSKLIEALGGKGRSAAGLAHLGDYEATLFSAHSHNRLYGENFAKGHLSNKRAEGIETLLAVKTIFEEKNLDLPICKALHAILFEHADIQETLKDLFIRSPKNEF